MPNFALPFLLLLAVDGVVCGRAKATPPLVFIFGDSYFDAGNNNYINTSSLDKADFWPYGETYFPRPTGRFSDGRLISDFIAEHASMPLIPPYLQPGRDQQKKNYHGVNFASAGAGALPLTFQGMVIDLPTQQNYYERELAELSQTIGQHEAAAISSSGVYMFSIGTNDYISPFLLNSSMLSSYPPSKYVEMVIGNLTVVLKAIYQKGGRNFVFLNLGELGCLPGVRIQNPQGNGCLKEASNLAEMHNKALHKQLSTMENHLNGFKYFIFDFKTSLAHMMASPHAYGLKEGKRACCGSGDLNGVFSCGGRRMVRDFELCENPNEFIFWDSFHLTQSVYKQMADEMWREPYNLNKFFTCF